LKTILFVNTTVSQCGVWQYGLHLFMALERSYKFRFIYLQPENPAAFHLERIKHDPVAVFYNWHPDQHGWMEQAPFDFKGVKQFLIYHDWDAQAGKWDGVLISDPTRGDGDNWYSIPRPLPQWSPTVASPVNYECPTLGVHGFGGASADWLVTRAIDEYDNAVVRLHLPWAYYGDNAGESARKMADLCREHVKRKPSIELQIQHHWMSVPRLLAWLSLNDMNVYLRDPAAHWHGVSSALDSALAVRRPLAINKCMGFRHLHGVTPSILVENRSLKDILKTGIEPLKAVYEQHSTANLVKRVEEILAAKGVHGD
jgi:hypothetical protein